MRGSTIRIASMTIICLILYKKRFKFLKLIIVNIAFCRLLALFSNTFFRRRVLSFLLRSLKKVSQ